MRKKKFINTKQSLTRKDIEKDFKEYYPPLTAFAAKMTKNPQTAEDIVQEYFIYLLTKKDKVKIHTSRKAFYYKSIYNRCINHINQTRNREEKHEEYKNENASAPGRAQLMEETEWEYRLYQAIEKLPEKRKLVLKLNRLEGYSNKEIAARLDISLRTVETHMSHALKQLRKELAKEKNFFFPGNYVFLFLDFVLLMEGTR